MIHNNHLYQKHIDWLHKLQIHQTNHQKVVDRI